MTEILSRRSLHMLEHHCELTDATLKTDISNEQTTLKEEGTKLTEATMEVNKADEKARVVAQEHSELKNDLDSMMKKCNDNYINFETEQCGLRKIRGELVKLVGTFKGLPFIQ